MKDWLEVAKTLPLGRKTRTHHECGTDKPLIVSNGDNGYSAYCFRCGNVGFVPHGYRSLAELAEVRKLNDIARQGFQSCELPEDFTFEIPPEGRIWLFRAGICVERANRHGIGYSPSLRRVVLTVRDRHGAVIYWQARAILPGQTPKYINPEADRANILFVARGGNERKALPNQGNTGAGSSMERVVIITEDILSAIRVSKFGKGVSTLGTKVTPEQAQDIASQDCATLVWLDPDKAGLDGAAHMRRQLSLLSVRVQTVYSDADPKNLPDKVIEEKICESLKHLH